MDGIKPVSDIDREAVWEKAQELAGCLYATGVQVGELMNLVKDFLEPDVLQFYDTFFNDAFGLADKKGTELCGLLEKIPPTKIKVDEKTTLTLEPFRRFTANMHTDN
jgi:hypothetical protein